MRRLAIQNLFKCMGTIQIFIDPHPSPIGILYSPPGLNYDLSIELYTCISYMNILNMRTKILCHRNEKEINKKFVWLKVASVNISRSTVSDCGSYGHNI
jgi:hypothetical protein